MAEEVGTIKFFKTDEGMKIEVTGDVMKQMGCCCVPVSMAGSDCCEPVGKEGKAVKIVCCPPSDKKD